MRADWFCFSESRLQRWPTLQRRKVKFTGCSSSGLNQLMHALNGNIFSVQWNVPTPSPRSSQWKLSFTIPSGMAVFAYSFYGNQSLWIRYCRRGNTSEIETNRSSSPRLYGMMLRSVASRGGGPGSRWTYFQASSKYWTARPRASSSSMVRSCFSTNIHEWNHLSYEGEIPFDDMYDIVSIPTGFDLNIATWNVEGLREISKYDQILPFSLRSNIHLLAALLKRLNLIPFTLSKKVVGKSSIPALLVPNVMELAFLSPPLSVHMLSIFAHTPRICELTVCTNSHPITVFSIYAPRQVDDPDEDQSRQASFWSQLDTIVAEHSNSSHILLLGDINARLDQNLDVEQDSIGPNVWGKRQNLDDPLRDDAVYLFDFLQSHILLLPQTFTTLPPRKLVT